MTICNGMAFFITPNWVHVIILARNVCIIYLVDLVKIQVSLSITWHQSYVVHCLSSFFTIWYLLQNCLTKFLRNGPWEKVIEICTNESDPPGREGGGYYRVKKREI